MNPPYIFAERKLQLKRNSFFCTIPKGIVKRLKLKKGDILRFGVGDIDERIHIFPIHIFKEDEQNG